MTLQFLNFWHFFWFGMYALTTLSLHHFLKSKKKEDQRCFLYKLILLNLFIHFAGPLLVWGWTNDAYTRMFMINICGFLVLAAPLLFFAKERFLKTGFVYACILGGFIVSLHPSEYFGDYAFAVDTIRFYVQHILLFNIGVLTLTLGHLKLKWRDIWSLPIMMFFAAIYVMANLVVMEAINLIEDMTLYNGAFIWSPQGIDFFPSWLVPTIFRTETGYLPLLWKLPIYFTFYPLIALLITYLHKNAAKQSLKIGHRRQ